MDNNLPEIDIVEDIASVMDDEPSAEKVQMTIDDNQKKEAEDDSPFVQPDPPKKKKKELSEKQKAHLERIRKLANNKRKEKAEAKKDALKKVEEEHNAKKKYQKRTKNIPVEEPREKNEVKKSTPDDFVPSHKAQVAEKKKVQEEKSKYEFQDFMKHMEQYNFMKYVYEQEQLKNKPKAPQPQAQKPKPPPQKPRPKAQPVSLVPPKIDDPYGGYFG